MGISFESSGSFDKTMSFLKRAASVDIAAIMHACGYEGVNALSRATPIDTGRAAHSWSYEVSAGAGFYVITWLNSDVENGFPVALMIQYGHGTGTGGYINGYDYINPAIRPIFDKIRDTAWKAVTSA
jgi:hypothetical protein